ncbi:MAG: hypothetical protein ACLUHE_16315 [Christensenellales bacterium]
MRFFSAGCGRAGNGALRLLRYAYETQLAQGFIPLEGGCRAGVCGRVTRDNDGAARLSSPTSVCIRMAREISGASEAVFPF